MKKFVEIVEKKVKEKVEYHVANCIKCNNNIITDNIYEDLKHKPIMLINTHKHCYGRYTGPINEFGAKCYKCGASYIESDSDSDRGKNKYEAAAVWNKYNDIDTLIAKHQVDIKTAQDEIERLKQIKQVRSKVTDLN